MPAYQIHRLKETPRQQFRWAPHTPGVTIVKLKDYEQGTVVEAASPYALWLALRESDHALAVGDLIEVVSDLMSAPGGELRILKYIGFEEARWYVPEPAPSATEEPVAVT
ncbi:MAG: hypothetical protein ACLPWF_15430 [Bryobacteraceae bacterium]